MADKLTLRKSPHSVAVAGRSADIERVADSQSHWPTIKNPTPVNPVWNAVGARYNYRSAAIWQSMHVGAVKCLHKSVSPCAIRGRVAFGIISPLDGKIVSVASIYCPISKGFKRAPLGTNADALASVVRLADPSAAPVHILPSRIKARARLPMRPAPSNRGLDRQAAARPRLPVSKITAAHRSLHPTVALAQPKSAAARSVPVLMEDQPAIKSLSVDPDLAGVFYHA